MREIIIPDDDLNRKRTRIVLYNLNRIVANLRRGILSTELEQPPKETEEETGG